MSGKRVLTDMDPDYEDIVEHQVKRQRAIEQDAKEASVQKINQIIQTQFQIEIENKEAEIKEVDQRLHQARAMMDRLRAVIVASYYSRLQQESGKMQSTSAAPLPSIHPTVKKHIGKAPVGVQKTTSQSSHPSSSVVSLLEEPVSSITMKPQSIVTTDTPSSSPRQQSTCVQPLKEGLRQGSRFTVNKTVIVGNVSRFILPDKREPNDQSTHKWMVYVRGPSDEPRIDSFVSKVWFFLHPSYKPNDLVEVSSPPFHLTRRGWGMFPVRVQLHFRDPRNKRVDIIHNLKLDETYTGLQTLGTETVVKVELIQDPAPSSCRIQSPAITTQPDHVTVEAVVKTESAEATSEKTQATEHYVCGNKLTSHHTCVHTKDQSLVSDSPKRTQGENGTGVTIKEEPPDDFVIEGSGQGNTLSGTELCSVQTVRKEIEWHESLPDITMPCKIASDSVLDKTKDAIQNRVDLLEASCVVSDKNMHIQQSVQRKPFASSDNKTAPCRQAPRQDPAVAPAVRAPLVVVPKTNVLTDHGRSVTTSLLRQPNLAQHSVQNKAVSLLSGSKPISSLSRTETLSVVQPQQGSSHAKISVSSTSAAKVLVITGSTTSSKSFLGCVSRPESGTALNNTKPAEVKLVENRPLHLLKVTPQGLKPVSDKMLIGLGQGQNAASQNVPSGTPVISMENHKPTVVQTAGLGNSKSMLSSGSGLTSLLKTAPQPAVRALLQKQMSSSASSTNNPSSNTRVLTPSSSSGAPLTVSSGDSYIVANLNNKKVLMRIDNSTLRKVQKDGSSLGHTSGTSSANGSNWNAASLPVQLAFQESPPAFQQPSTQSTQLFISSARTLQTTTKVPVSICESRKSHTEAEQARIRATLQKSQSQGIIMSQAAIQLARIKAAIQEQNHVEAPPKSRCARWFRQGLGSSMLPPANCHDASNEQECVVKVDLPQNCKVDARLSDKSEAEKRIVVKKKSDSSDIAVGYSPTSLSVEEYNDMSSLIRAAILRHPLLVPATDKCIHPYSAESLEQWKSWHPAKRVSAEWSRAFAVKKFLQRHLAADAIYKGEQLWSTKRIMQYCRFYGWSPNGPGGLITDMWRDVDHNAVRLTMKRFFSLSGADCLFSRFSSVEKTEEEEEKDDSCDPVDVEVVSVENPVVNSVVVKQEVKLQPDLDFLPTSDEAFFVQDVAAQINVRFSPVVLAPGVFASTAEDMIFAAMLEFANDILHQAISFTFSKDSSPPTMTSQEVFQALKSHPVSALFTNQFCGVQDPTSPVKR